MLLAVDTSTPQVGLALYAGEDGVLAEWTWRSANRHTEHLAPMLALLLQRVGVTWAEVEALGVALGPGSFTGLRVGLALVKALALARHLPVVGVPTLDAVAAAVPPEPETPLAAVLPAGRGRLAVAWYRAEGTPPQWRAVAGPEVLAPDDLARRLEAPTLIAGELDRAARARLRRRKNARLLSPALGMRRPALLAERAWLRYRQGERDDPATLAPIYLHTGPPIPS